MGIFAEGEIPDHFSATPIAQLLIRKLGSFIRLTASYIAYGSDIRLATSDIRSASLGGE